MAECANCSQVLRPEWKFCIRCGAPVARAVRPVGHTHLTLAPPPPVTRVNTLAVLALIFGCLASPIAALFGHVALAQIHGTRERGRTVAIVGIALGYLWLALIVGLVIIYLVSHA